jgi:hypothetical protein
MALAEVPPLFAGVLRFAPGDAVETPFGGGCVLASGDRQAHVAVRLDMGATLYARVRSDRGCLWSGGARNAWVGLRD